MLLEKKLTHNGEEKTYRYEIKNDEKKHHFIKLIEEAYCEIPQTILYLLEEVFTDEDDVTSMIRYYGYNVSINKNWISISDEKLENEYRIDVIE